MMIMMIMIKMITIIEQRIRRIVVTITITITKQIKPIANNNIAIIIEVIIKIIINNCDIYNNSNKNSNNGNL